MIKAFVFDIGNVLLEFDYLGMLDTLVARSQNSAIVDHDDLERAIGEAKIAYESGTMSREAFVAHVTSSIGFDGTTAEFERIWEDVFSLNPLNSDLVAALETHYPLYLLSNTNDLHLAWFIREYRIFDCFSDGIYSHLAGCMKPDVGIYHQALAKFGIEADAAVFIDDLAANIDTARSLGFHAFQYSVTDHDALLEWLEQLGVNFQRPSGASARNS